MIPNRVPRQIEPHEEFQNPEYHEGERSVLEARVGNFEAHQSRRELKPFLREGVRVERVIGKDEGGKLRERGEGFSGWGSLGFCGRAREGFPEISTAAIDSCWAGVRSGAGAGGRIGRAESVRKLCSPVRGVQGPKLVGGEIQISQGGEGEDLDGESGEVVGGEIEGREIVEEGEGQGYSGEIVVMDLCISKTKVSKLGYHEQNPERKKYLLRPVLPIDRTQQSHRQVERSRYSPRLENGGPLVRTKRFQLSPPLKIW